MSLSPEQLTTINSLYTKLAATPKTDRAQIKSLALEYYDSIKPVDEWYATMAQDVIKDKGLSAITANNYAYNKLNHDLGLDYPSHVPEIWKGLAMADYEARKDKKDGHLKKLSGADIAQYHTDVFKQVYGPASKAEEAWTAYHLSKVLGSESWVGKDGFWGGVKIYWSMASKHLQSDPQSPEYRHYFEWLQDMRLSVWDGRKGPEWSHSSWEKGDGVIWKSLEESWEGIPYPLNNPDSKIAEVLNKFPKEFFDFIKKYQESHPLGMVLNGAEDLVLDLVYGFYQFDSDIRSIIKKAVQEKPSRIKMDYERIKKYFETEGSLATIKQGMMLESYKKPDEAKWQMISSMITAPKVSQPGEDAASDADDDLIDCDTVDMDMLKRVNDYTPERMLFAINKKHVKAGKKDCLIIGGNNKDKLAGGDGDDLIIGGKGRDCLKTGNGSNTLIGGPGNDKLIAHCTKGTSVNYLYGGEGKDKIIAGGHKDLGTSMNHLYGGEGNDKIFFHGSHHTHAVIDAGKGNDLIFLKETTRDENVRIVFHKGDGHDFIESRKNGYILDLVDTDSSDVAVFVPRLHRTTAIIQIKSTGETIVARDIKDQNLQIRFNNQDTTVSLSSLLPKEDIDQLKVDLDPMLLLRIKQKNYLELKLPTACQKKNMEKGFHIWSLSDVCLYNIVRADVVQEDMDQYFGKEEEATSSEPAVTDDATIASSPDTEEIPPAPAPQHLHYPYDFDQHVDHVCSRIDKKDINFFDGDNYPKPDGEDSYGSYMKKLDPYYCERYESSNKKYQKDLVTDLIKITEHGSVGDTEVHSLLYGWDKYSAVEIDGYIDTVIDREFQKSYGKNSYEQDEQQDDLLHTSSEMFHDDAMIA
ncbi:Hemolysin-type calcium-binding region [Liberibacter crescens BT-1]|uniref:Hemolysin-type calcium-binding region n=1 Tax=Liberibacter crescens (strain BT-1) TaxID=1215343 RepID=L0EUC5_LIBCB|nr:calcium-binding protein [Liberibacter crescens]AGA64547.1 Hemolysin-type calcium-binding region [Liberibacter crescens BT-1]